MKAFICTFLRPESSLSAMVESSFTVQAKDLIEAKSKALAELNAPHRLKFHFSLVWIKEVQ